MRGPVLLAGLLLVSLARARVSENSDSSLNLEPLTAQFALVSHDAPVRVLGPYAGASALADSQYRTCASGGRCGRALWARRAHGAPPG